MSVKELGFVKKKLMQIHTNSQFTAWIHLNTKVFKSNCPFLFFVFLLGGGSFFRKMYQNLHFEQKI